MRVLLAICFMLSAAGIVFAEPSEHRPWELGTEASYILYDEPGVMDEEGFMLGILGSYTYRSAPQLDIEGWMLKGEGRFSYGQVDYDGQLSDGTTYTIDDIDDYMLEFRTLAGYDFILQEKYTLTPYLGFGYRYLNDDLATDAAGYERESNYYYSPIGVEALTDLENGWTIGLSIEYDLFWKGLQKSHLSDAVAALNDIENDQEDGYGIRGSIRFQKKTEKADWIIEPFVRYWDIDESEEAAVTLSGTIIGTGVEPENDSTEVGVRLAVRF